MPQEIRLQRHNIIHKIIVRCQHRYALYEQQLTKSFNTIINLSQPPNNPKIAKALQDKKLFQELANLLDAFVVPGITSDLYRTGKGRLKDKPNDNLFEWLDIRTSKIPSAKKIFEPEQLNSNTYSQLDEYKLFDYKVDTYQAYQNYARFYVANDVQGFFARNPLCQHAVKKIADNFTTNIKTFAINILNDWNDINNCFFGGNAKSLEEITTTGSDYHKGGKQVLILTFKLNTNKTEKLVYKPSDIEVDCRLVGDIQAVKKYLPTGLQITNSFAELVNEFTKDDCPLQTYKILPRNPGSLLQPDKNGVIPIRNSYGYIEYLNHQPSLDTAEGITDENRLKQAENVPLNEIADSDWITVDSDDAQKYWQTTGKLLAMLIVCGCTDIHGQNFRIHKKKPQVIDLEEAFKERHKTIQDVFSNFETLDRVDDPGTREPAIYKDRTLKIELEYKQKKGFLLNQLVIRLPAITHKIAKRTDYIEPLIKGFIKTLYALRKDDNNQRIMKWLDEVKNMIVRHVTVATSQLANEMRAVFYQVKDDLPNNNQQFVNFGRITANNQRGFFVGTFLTNGGEGYITRFNKEYSNMDNDELAWKRLPRFAICHPEHNFHDFFNLDVPSYYHRLSDRHLLNSRGMRVIPKDTWKWWKDNVFDKKIATEPTLKQNTGRKNTAADTFEEFFPDTPYNLFKQIFQDLKNEQKFQEFIKNNIAYLGRGNTQKIELQVDNDTYTIPVDTKPASFSYASEFKTPSSEQPVLLNGMKVIFDKSAPVYPVSLVNKD